MMLLKLMKNHKDFMKVKIPQMLIWELVKKILIKKVKTKKTMMKIWIKKSKKRLKKKKLENLLINLKDISYK